MDEPTQPYHEVRALLEDLVASWPWDRPGTAFENAKVYLDFHCVDCGAKLSVNDLAVVLELEMLRLGTVDARRVPYFDPICVRCYLRRAAPACHAFPSLIARRAGGDVRYLPDAQDMNVGALRASADRTYTRTYQRSAEAVEEHPTPLGSSSLQHIAQPGVFQHPLQPQRARWRQVGEYILVVALLLIVLALSISLNSRPKQAHISTLTRPTAPTMPIIAVPTSRPGGSSFRRGTSRPGAIDQTGQRTERLRSGILMEA